MFLSKISIMWPMLLDMTRDDCRRTLRRLELEAYSSMISVFRAQGALADDRKKLLEDLRGALNISNDRHTAEARRVSNDELLATIAEQLSGPNTGLGWVCEGRRKIPILPRGIPQTMYTELADQAAILATNENDKMAQRKLLGSSEQKKVTPVTPADAEEGGEEDMDVDETCAATGEGVTEKDENNIIQSYPPVVLWDQSSKLAAEEGPPRKKSRPDLPSPLPSSPPASVPPQPKANHQRYLNISQIYSNYNKAPTNKVSNTSAKNYNQGGKIQGKANHGPKSVSKHRNIHGKHANSSKNSGQVAIPHHQVRSGIKSPTDPHIAGSQALNIQNPIDVHTLKSQTSGFQANFAQSIAKKIASEESNIDINQPILSTPQMESQTMQLLTQPAIVQQESIISTPSPDETINIPVSNQVSLTSTNVTAPGTPTKMHVTSGKACHLIIKKKTDTPGENVSNSPKIHVTNMQFISKPSDMGGIKVLQNRQVVVAPPHSTSQKMINSSGKLITTKFVQQIPQRSQAQLNSNIVTKSSNAPSTGVMEKVIIVSKSMSPTVQSSILQRSLSSTPAKNIIISSHNTPSTPLKEADNVNQSNKGIEGDNTLPKMPVNNADVKMPPKTFLVNPKSGQKMVVLPAKARSKGSLIGQVPLLQVKGLPGRQTAMKLVPLGNQTVNSQTKSNNVTIVSKTNSNILTKVVSKESLAHINSPNLDNSSMKQTHIQIAPKPKGQAIIRPVGPNTKSNLILLQKGNTITKGSSIAFTKNGSDLTKIMMTNKINTNTTQPTNIISESDINCGVDLGKNPGNVIVLQLSNDQLEQAGNLTEFLQANQAGTGLNVDEHSVQPEHTIITEDTPVLFHNQISDQVCNTDSMESTTDTLMEVVHMDETPKNEEGCQISASAGKEIVEESETTATSIVTDWDINVENTLSGQKPSNEMDKQLAMELEMSSDSDTDGYMDSSQDESKKEKEQMKNNVTEQPNPVPADESNEMFQQHSSISQASRTLLSQLQDDGSSSNDSSFVLSKNLVKKFNVPPEMRSQSPKESVPQSEPALKTKGPEGGATAESNRERATKIQGTRMDIFSTAIASADINLDSFEYLEDGMISGDEMFHLAAAAEQTKSEGGEQPRGEEAHKEKSHPTLEQQLHQLLGDDNIDEPERLEELEPSCTSTTAME